MNLEKNYINLIIDIGNQIVKFGYQNNNDFIINKIPKKDLLEQLPSYLASLNINHIYIGSVSETTKNQLTNYLTNNKYSYSIIENEWFLESLKINEEINLHEIGTDILGLCYLIKDHHHALFLNFGTASVIFKHTDQLEGVMIGNDLLNSWNYLYELLHINPYVNNVMHENDDIFKTNTIDALNSFKNIVINGMVNQILNKNKDIKNIYVSGGNSQIFQNYYENSQNIPVFYVEEATIKGYFALIKDKFKIF